LSKEFKIDIDKETSKGQYSNLAVISHTPTEFFIDFVLAQPQGVSQVVARIITNPRHAKALAHSLLDNIRKYEEKFGEIPDMPLPSGLPEGPQA